MESKSIICQSFAMFPGNDVYENVALYKNVWFHGRSGQFGAERLYRAVDGLDDTYVLIQSDAHVIVDLENIVPVQAVRALLSEYIGTNTGILLCGKLLIMFQWLWNALIMTTQIFFIKQNISTKRLCISTPDETYVTNRYHLM